MTEPIASMTGSQVGTFAGPPEADRQQQRAERDRQCAAPSGGEARAAHSNRWSWPPARWVVASQGNCIPPAVTPPRRVRAACFGSSGRPIVVG
jgi:hypothetical protein